MKNVGFLCLAQYPVPAIKGGAVETLVTNLLDENEKNHLFNMFVYSFADSEAQKRSQDYRHTSFYYVKKTLCRKITNKLYVKAMKILGIHDSLYYHQIRRQIQKADLDALVLEASSSYADHLKKDFPELPIYLHIHNIPTEKALTWDWGNLLERCLCISQFIAEETIKRLHIKSEKVALFYNSVDADLFVPVKSTGEKCKYRKKYGFTDEDKIIIFTGRLQPYKGISHLIRAVTDIDDEKIKLLIVGSSFFSASRNTPFIENLKSIAKGYEDRIIFTGFVPHHQITECYQIADIAVLPSIWEEPFGLTCLEALSCGLPVIATKSGALPEIVLPSCGILLEKDEMLEKRLSDSILNLLTNDKLCNEMGREARKRALHFNIQEYLKNFYRLINRK